MLWRPPIQVARPTAMVETAAAAAHAWICAGVGSALRAAPSSPGPTTAWTPRVPIRSASRRATSGPGAPAGPADSKAATPIATRGASAAGGRGSARGGQRERQADDHDAPVPCDVVPAHGFCTTLTLPSRRKLFFRVS